MMEEQRQEFRNLIDILTETQLWYILTLVKLASKLSEYQIRHFLSLAKLVDKLSEYQMRYLIAFTKKRFNL